MEASVHLMSDYITPKDTEDTAVKFEGDTFTSVDMLETYQAGDTGKDPAYKHQEFSRRINSDNIFSSPLKTPTPQTVELLNEAFMTISYVIEEKGGSARSNLFDDWKDSLYELSRVGVHFSVKHRQILGALLAATREKDVIDFTQDQLKLFLEPTNLLRTPRLIKSETRQALISISGCGTPLLPLSVDGISDEEGRKLDEFLMQKIEESRA